MSHDSQDADVDAMLRLWRAVRTDLDSSALVVFRSSRHLAVTDAIAIYKNAYWARQHEALRELFPRVVTQLGNQRFRELTLRYLRACPSAHPELERIGAALPAFMREHSDADFARAASVGAYEQALVESFLAPDSRAATLEEIRPHTFAAARLSFVPSLRVVATDSALLHVLTLENHDVIGAHAAVIARPRFVTVTHLIGRDELEVLALARSNRTVAELLDHCDNDVPGLHVLIDRWFRRRWIEAIREELS